jgi:NAD(P)H-dependent FMN reductase
MTTKTATGPVRIALIIGSVRWGRLAGALADWTAARVRQMPSVDLDVIDLADEDLPMHALTPGGADSPISRRLHNADGFLLITPEYKHSFPAALKNAIDWHFAEWAYKPVAFVGYGASGGVRAIEQLRQVFPELRSTTIRDAVLLNRPWERFDEQGGYLAAEHEAAALEATMDELGWWARTLREGRALRREVA